MRTKAKRISLVACLFLFLFVVIGNALHLNPAGAFLAAATGTPLLIYVFNQRSADTTTNGKRVTKCRSVRWPRSRARRSLCWLGGRICQQTVIRFEV